MRLPCLRDITTYNNFVEFVTQTEPAAMPGLRLDEALHPLTIIAVGLYGDVLPNQNGAPLRLVVPWKYGFKSGKSIVRIRFAACLWPLAQLVWLGWSDALGANPIEFVTRHPGTWTLNFLLITLAVTPLRQLSGWHWLIRLHRSVYAIAIIGVIHYWWLVKKDITLPLLYAVLVGALLGLRALRLARAAKIITPVGAPICESG